MISCPVRQLMCQHCGHKFEIIGRAGVVACPLCLRESIIPELKISVPSCWEENGGER